MSVLLEQLLRAGSLPSPPGVALEVMRMNQDEEVSIQQLADVISRDPAIAARLLKTANSSALGRPREVADIEDAVMVLGTRSVNLLALSFSLVGVSKTGVHDGFDYGHFWVRAAVTAIASRLLATQHLPSQREEAFLAGLLCDFAQLILIETLPDLYVPVLARRRRTAEPIEGVERELLESDHAELGSAILEKWGLPALITDSIAAHHDPMAIWDATPPRFELAQILHLAGTCGELYLDGRGEAADELVALGQAYFEMSAPDCQALLDSLRELVPEFLAILGPKVIDASECARIRAQASELLVRESLALDQRVQDISTTLERLRHRNCELERRASTDALTGLANRSHFEARLERELGKLGEGGSLGLLMMDVDRFKSINDSYGHPAGDAVLREIGRLLAERLGPNDVAARCGGDEFTALLPGVSPEALLDWAQIFRRSVEDGVSAPGGQRIEATLSIGGCVLRGSGAAIPASDAIHAADAALYRAKAKGRNRVIVTRLPSGRG